MSKIDKTYHNLLDKILQEGYTYEDPNRKGVNRIEIPSYTFRHEFKDGFPAITTKKLHYKNVVTELIWFLRGDTNIKYLIDNGCNIWNKDAYNYLKRDNRGYQVNVNDFLEGVKKEYCYDGPNFEWGNLGPVYGHQWRDFNGIDQIQRLITNLKEKPLATDHIVNSWNVGDLENMALQPCHYGFQVIVRPLSFKEQLELYKNGSYSIEGIAHSEEIITSIRKNKSIPFGILRKDMVRKWNLAGLPQYGFELHWSQRSVDTFLG